MLDWSKIDNDKTFQRLVSHLISLECHTPGFLPSSPYIGADGGYDAYVDNYPEENLSGNICIQSKFTKHSLKKAYEYLRGEVKKELDKAKGNNISHVVLVTNAELKVGYIKDLVALNHYKEISLWIWDREKLTIKIEKQPFLRSYFFNSPAITLFVPASIYFEEVEKNLIDLDGGPLQDIKTIKGKFDELISFLKNEKMKIFVIHAPGGYGKSHFLRELPIKTKNASVDREIWFIRDGIRDIREAFNDEIGVRESVEEKHKYIFVLDDADRADDIKDILFCITKSGIDAKIVISLRTAGILALEDALVSAKCRDVAVLTSIPQWSNDELKMLLRAAAQKAKVNDEDEIIRRYPNPFFIVRIGLNIRGKSDYDFQLTKQAILQSLLNDANKVLSSEQIDVEELLLHLTLITPINITHSQTNAKLAQKLNVDERQIGSILEKLLKGGVLRSIGNILRFIPDMIGDIFLLEKMQSINEDVRKQTFLYWLDTHSKNIFCNLGATLMYGDKDCLVPIVTDVISGWINNAGKYDSYERRQVLENLEDICKIIPDKTLDLLWTFLDGPDLTTDAYGPIVVRLIHSELDRKEIVKIVEGLRKKAKQGTFDNYKPNTLVRETVTPLRNNIEKQIIPILSIIENSLRDEEPIIQFAKAALQEVLAAAHEWTHSTYGAMEFGSRSLKATDSVLKMRNKAIEIAKKMLLDSRSIVRLSAIEIVEDIGRSHFGPGISDIPLKDKIIEERQDMLEFIDQNNLVDKEGDLNVLSSYEDLLFSWWARKDVPDEKILPLLNKFTYDSEYRIYRYYTSRWDISDDVHDRLKTAPSEGRWGWVVDNIMQRKWQLTVDDFQKDAESLNHKYSTSESITNYLQALGKKVTISSANALFLRAWFKQNPDAFRQIRLNKDMWDKIPLIFKYTITYDVVQKYPDMAKIIIDQVLFAQETSLDESKIAVDILSYDLPSLDKYGIIKSVAEKNIDDLNLTIIERMRFIGDKIAAKEMAEIVLIVLNHLTPQAQVKSIDHIAFILHNKNKDYINEFFDVTRNAIYLTLVNDGKLEYHDFEIASLIFTDVKVLMDFVETRLEQEKKINKYSEYEAVPFDGINFLDKVVKNYDDYLFVIEKVLEWDEKYEGITSFSVSKIFEQVVLLKNGAGKLYMEDIKNKFYDIKHFSKFLACLSRLPLTRSNINIFSEAIQKSKEFRSEEEMSRLLKSKIYPEGGWSSSVGQVPPAFIEKKEAFETLKNSAPAGLLRNSLDECVQGVEKMIEEHNREEENRFHSR